MKTKRLYIVSLIVFMVFLIHGNLFAKEIKTNKTYFKDDTTLNLFLRSENKLTLLRQKNKQNGKYNDPLSYYDNWLMIVKSNSPMLLERTNYYSRDLINILLNANYEKNKEFKIDILMILYHQCVDDYTTTLTTLFDRYRKGNIEFDMLRMSIDQDLTFCNVVAKNYHHLKLRQLLNSIKNDTLLLKSEEGRILKARIEEILNGNVWKNEAKEILEIQGVKLKIGC